MTSIWIRGTLVLLAQMGTNAPNGTPTWNPAAISGVGRRWARTGCDSLLSADVDSSVRQIMLSSRETAIGDGPRRIVAYTRWGEPSLSNAPLWVVVTDVGHYDAIAAALIVGNCLWLPTLRETGWGPRLPSEVSQNWNEALLSVGGLPITGDTSRVAALAVLFLSYGTGAHIRLPSSSKGPWHLEGDSTRIPLTLVKTMRISSARQQWRTRGVVGIRSYDCEFDLVFRADGTVAKAHFSLQR
jgi:hypothetical protein